MTDSYPRGKESLLGFIFEDEALFIHTFDSGARLSAKGNMAVKVTLQPKSARGFQSEFLRMKLMLNYVLLNRHPMGVTALNFLRNYEIGIAEI